MRDADHRLVAARDFPERSSGSFRQYLMLPPGRCRLRVTTASGLSIEREFEVDPERPAGRAILVPLVPESR